MPLGALLDQMEVLRQYNGYRNKTEVSIENVIATNLI